MKKAICIMLSVMMIMLCFSGCTSTEMTEDNIEKTVDKAFSALVSFDTKKLDKYVESKTLKTIIGYAEKHDQFKSLGKAIFSNLEYKVKAIDIENQTVTVNVKNKNLYEAASGFASELKSNYSVFQLLKNLSDDEFLDTNLKSLCDKIESSPPVSEGVDVTLNIKKGSKNLVLSFDEESENAVSGGALSAIKGIYGSN